MFRLRLPKKLLAWQKIINCVSILEKMRNSIEKLNFQNFLKWHHFSNFRKFTYFIPKMLYP